MSVAVLDPKQNINSRATFLMNEIISFNASISVATYNLLMLIEEYAREEYYLKWEMPSMAAWLSWQCHMSDVTAREHVRVAKTLPALPKIRAAFSTGAISYSKVRAVTRIATPAIEQALLDLAIGMTGEQLEKTVKGYKRYCLPGKDENESANERAKRRYASHSWNNDGMLEVRMRLTPEDGVVYINALEASIAKELPAGTDGKEIYETRDTMRADAVVEMSRRAMATDVGGAPAAAELVIHADYRIVQNDPRAIADPMMLRRVQNGPSLAPAVVQRLACDSPIRGLFKNGSEPLDIGRRSRTWPWAMRVAILARDGGCIWPGCINTHHLNVHHMNWWSLDGPTSVENGASLCAPHHRAVHEGGFAVARVDGAFAITRADGSVVEMTPPPMPKPEYLAELMRMRGITVDPAATHSKWDGQRPNYSETTGMLAGLVKLAAVDTVEEAIAETERSSQPVRDASAEAQSAPPPVSEPIPDASAEAQSAPSTPCSDPWRSHGPLLMIIVIELRAGRKLENHFCADEIRQWMNDHPSIDPHDFV